MFMLFFFFPDNWPFKSLCVKSLCFSLPRIKFIFERSPFKVRITLKMKNIPENGSSILALQGIVGDYKITWKDS